ncbi:transposase [Burkholderia vietnamiensis]|uniref:transposase n=2 Tax=Burkholderia vietnamiensis TaxID=60552 RepID=UPI0012D92F0B|nr:transposase [Burkholderia vietnamiensis]MBR7916035.1 transposase [Burkholderia vietnamiensis]MBR7975271.1 transposase [Burkholderia vietnamiensis]MBR8357086.1 transposase [Burkholderia vietnamiensis]HDR8964764.1 transposase [Burkholderia vietnamiensis]HDR9155317.1 transposase [Burkholderia vietnamiensis]
MPWFLRLEMSMTPYRDLTDQEWRSIVPLLPEMKPRTELRGRPLANTRAVLNGVLWVIYSGATWSAMPRRYPSYQTCHRRFKAWHDTGTLMQVMSVLYGEAGVNLCNALSARMRKHCQPDAVAVPDAAVPAYVAHSKRAAADTMELAT